MTKVNINGMGHQVEIDHDGTDLAYVIEKAEKLWKETRPRAAAGSTIGYTHDAQPNNTVRNG